jgi:hypothetical protein
MEAVAPTMSGSSAAAALAKYQLTFEASLTRHLRCRAPNRRLEFEQSDGGHGGGGLQGARPSGCYWCETVV